METYSSPLGFAGSSEDQRGGKSVNKAYLVNKLNYINFQDQTISVCLRHNKYDNPISVSAKPLPCAGERLDCLWMEEPGVQQVFSSYRFDHLLFNDGKKFLMMTPKVISMDEEGLSVLLPMNGREFRIRKIRRHPTSGIGVQITQDGVLLQGTLADFTPVSLRVETKVPTPQTFKWLNYEAPVNVHLYQGKTMLYAGPCRITRNSHHENRGTFVLSVTNHTIERYGRRCDDLPQQLFPSPNMLFAHPLISKTVTLKLVDISGSSFSVEESEENSVLMTGMVIPELKLSFGHHLDITCRAQVVSRIVPDRQEGDPVAVCTLAILDMDIHEHVKLLSILQQASDKNSYICNSVDMDALWDFFFETGFVYPTKYAYFEANKERIKKTYARLYSHSPHIARHFIYQDKGAILGHISMVRFFENSWMIHHHAARKTVSLRAGMTVLDQICHYLHVLRNFHFAHLDHVYCYYRPDNKFPNRVFGGFAQQLNHRKGCSQDKFAFSHFRKHSAGEGKLPSPWELKPSCAFDLSELSSFYGFASGGLMINAFELYPEGLLEDRVAKDYQRLGFKKDKRIYSLCSEGVLKALVLANSTDAGLNMANLTNCVTLIVMDEEVPREIVELTLEKVCLEYEDNEVPVLIYPFSYVERVSYPFEKTYMLWILDLNYLDDFQEYSRRLFRGAKKSEATDEAGSES